MKCLLCGRELEEDTIIIPKIKDGKGKIYRCNPCDLSMYDSYAGNRYYQRDYRKEYHPILKGKFSVNEVFDYGYDNQLKKVQLMELNNTLNSRKDVLEVGCGPGHFLYYIKRKVNKIAGIEPDPEYANYAKKKCNCDIYRNLSELKDEFDVIVFTNSICTMENPIEEIEKYKRVLKNDGVVVVEVPNFNNILLKVFGVKGYEDKFYTQAYKWYFSGISLQNLLRRCGFPGELYYIGDDTLFNHLNWFINNDSNGENKKLSSVLDGSEMINYEINNYFNVIENHYEGLLINRGLTSSLLYIGRMV